LKKETRPSSATPSAKARQVEIRGPIDRRTAEELRLAISRLARRHHVAIGEIRVVREAPRRKKSG
jgi:hypothetical protein